MITRSLGLRFAVVSRSRGVTASMRSAYQMGGTVVDPMAIKRRYNIARTMHLAQWILLPDHAPAWANDASTLWRNAGLAERQCNAQEARVLDMQLPPEFPEPLIPDLARALYTLFADGGLAVQIDHHRQLLRNGADGHHLHAIIAMRRLTPTGFAKTKVDVRGWNAAFMAEQGRKIRRLMAGRFNAFATARGLNIRLDARSNRARGLPCPEPRLSRAIFRKPALPFSKACLDHLTKRRYLRAKWDELHATQRELAHQKIAFETKIAQYAAKSISIFPTDDTERQRSALPIARNYASFRRGRGDPVQQTELIHSSTLLLELGSTTIAIEHDLLTIEGGIDDLAIDCLAELVEQLGWTGGETLEHTFSRQFR